MNPEKTENQLWCGSNCGNTEDEIYRAMINTKKEYAKEWGRQGYHYVLSFPPGEADEKTVYDFGKKFCETYLGKNYEYCFAVHNDQAHMHCHIVFNSVDRISGHKYRYVDGDWEKRIQPVTDKLCQEFGLSVLEYDKEKKVGKSYVEHMADKSGKVTWSDIIRADIDAAAARSYKRQEFFDEMEQMGYRMRQGNSAHYGTYMAYTAPGTKKARRDYRLGPGYRLTDIDKKIFEKRNHMEPQAVYVSPFATISPQDEYQACIILRIKQATNYQIFKLEIKEQERVRKDLLRITKLEEECDYLIKHPIKDATDIQERLQNISEEIRGEKNRLSSKKNVLSEFSSEERELIHQYQAMKRKLLWPDLSDEEFENTMDNIEKFESNYDELLAYAYTDVEVGSSAKLDSLKYEKTILRRIEKDVKEAQLMKEVTFREEYVKKEEPSLTE